MRDDTREDLLTDTTNAYDMRQALKLRAYLIKCQQLHGDEITENSRRISRMLALVENKLGEF